jgi:hypothetical protein
MIKIRFFLGVLRASMVLGRILVLQFVHSFHARLFRMYARTTAAQKHAAHSSDGQQAVQDSSLPNASMGSYKQ